MSEKKENMLGQIVTKIVDFPLEVLGVIYDLIEKLTGKTGYVWLTELKKFLRKERCWVTPEFKIWKTIKLGTHTDVNALREALKNTGCGIHKWADDILNKPAFTTSTKETEINLVVVTVGELGFKNGTTRENIYKRAQELGLSLCPAEVGLQLCLQYTDQPSGEGLFIAMEPIADSEGHFNLFYVVHCSDGSGRLLVGFYIGPYAEPFQSDNFWYANNLWVFSCK